MKESDLDASIRLQDALPKVEYDGVSKIVSDIYLTGRYRKWASAARGHVLGGKDVYFEADGNDTEKLARLVIALRQEILSAGLEIDVFNFDDPEKMVHEDITKLVYDTLIYMTLHAEHSALRYPAKVDPRPILAMEQRLVRENGVADWTPTDLTRKEQLYASLDPEFYATIRVRYPRFSDLGGVPLRELKDLATSIFVSWQQQRADLGGAGGAASSAAVRTGDDKTVVEMLKTILGAVQVLTAHVNLT
ncbi:hypothetical protein CYMTET_49415 [Cymbomonas tetramitiformis]|uniref:Uncharacterized protein n=1 Tax=Cymbomonas tetramitiformis TaxID=36881 RepID=A0AAE0BRF7_9CHLO|nr:hypothetical protein CYMTET_49415 [Cymbomonas tetramitiformis]